MKRDMGSALRTSVHAEEKASDRFERAEEIFGTRSPSQAAKLPPLQPEHDRVIRDSFTMPTLDYDRIGQTRDRCLKAGVSITKSEVLRAGLTALAGMSDDELVALVKSLPKVKTGRPVQLA